MISLLIDYETYKEVSDSETLPESEPKWFRKYQMLAQRIILHNMVQVELWPTTYIQFAYLYPWCRACVVESICYQIDFIQEHKQLFHDFLLSNKSLGIGDYNEGPLNDSAMLRMLDHVCPMTYDVLHEQLGWMWKSLDRKLNRSNYYAPNPTMKLRSVPIDNYDIIE